MQRLSPLAKHLSAPLPKLGQPEMTLINLENTQGDSDVILMLAGFRRHLLGKTLINVFHCNIAEICFVGKLVIVQQTFS